ncbi:hypothetical protein [Nocardiopsis sp. LOL_012]|uniref:hypothetical protein n=1 Tax=Nocardiopsis sp. LOL_012 TaxID=3345409 RepID=UPI003A88059F
MLDNPLLLILLGACISLVTSVVVTAVQARLIRRDNVRSSSRASARNLTSAFIAERDAQDAKESYLTEAEMTVMSMTDRKTRERLRDVVRLLRERDLPEIEKLSGVPSTRARQILCDHALEVLGAHLRSERLPATPPEIRKMLSIEEEALSIHSGASPQADEPIAKSPVAARPRHTGTKSPAARKSGAKGTPTKTTPAKSTTAKSGGKNRTATSSEEPTPKDPEHSTFWDD